MRRATRWACLGLLLLLAACSRPRGEVCLFDFESDAELESFAWRCGQLFSLSEEHATHGRRSLRLELHPSPYPGLRPQISRRDWSGFSSLCFDVYNPQPEALPLAVRIDDVRNRANYANRFNRATRLAPGANRVRLPLAGLTTSGTGRRLDTGDIWALYIFSPHPDKVKVVYIDYLRLER
jgi:hypothetical protein